MLPGIWIKNRGPVIKDAGDKQVSKTYFPNDY